MALHLKQHAQTSPRHPCCRRPPARASLQRRPQTLGSHPAATTQAPAADRGSGSTNSNVLSLAIPPALTARRLPLWSSTSRRASDSPMPSPALCAIQGSADLREQVKHLFQHIARNSDAVVLDAAPAGAPSPSNCVDREIRPPGRRVIWPRCSGCSKALGQYVCHRRAEESARAAAAHPKLWLAASMSGLDASKCQGHDVLQRCQCLLH